MFWLYYLALVNESILIKSRKTLDLELFPYFYFPSVIIIINRSKHKILPKYKTQNAEMQFNLWKH